jgi:SecY
MAISQRSSPSVPTLGARVAVTLAALAAYRLCAYLPLPGIDPVAWASLYQGGVPAAAFERISVAGLGVTPLVSALLLVEMARLLSRPFNAWAASSVDNARRLERYAFIGAALLAAVQAYGIAIGLEAAGGLVTEPGFPFRLTIVATLVAGTAALMWLATVISRHGLGSGVWLLLLAPHLAGLPLFTVQILETIRTGVMSTTVPVALLAYTIGAVAILVGLGLTLKRMGMPLDRTLIWPLLMSMALVSALLAVAWAVVDAAPWLSPTSAETRHRILSLFAPGTPLGLALLAVTVVAVSLTQWRRVETQRTLAQPPSQPAEAAGSAPILLTALTLAAIVVVPSLLTAYLKAPILIDSRWLAVLVAVALPIAGMLRR